MKTQSKINYYEYIKSNEWQKVRKKYFSSNMFKTYSKKNKWTCYVCDEDNKPLDLHHRKYKRLGHEKIHIDLVPVCRDCHNHIHSLQKEKNLSLWGATKLIRRKFVRSKPEYKLAQKQKKTEKKIRSKIRSEKKAIKRAQRKIM